MRALALTTLALVGCNAAFGIGDLRFDDAATASSGGGVTSSSSTGGAGGSATGLPDGGGGTGGEGGLGGAGGQGGMAPALSEQGLLVRYYLDEGGGGMAQDAGPSGLHLQRTNAGNMSWTTDASERGMRWNAPGGNGYLGVPVDGTILQTGLDGSAVATVELVATLESYGYFDRLLHLGRAIDYGRLTVSTAAGQAGLNLAARTVDTDVARWAVAFEAAGRRVYHVVIDTSLGTDQQRVRLYVDGAETPWSFFGPTSLNPLQNGELLAIDDNNALSLGNRPSEGRSMHGTLHYAAIYERALLPDEIDLHVAILTGNDDSPGP